MAKAVILKTCSGVKLMGSFQRGDGSYWNAENCFLYCNSYDNDFGNSHMASRLLANSTYFGYYPKTGEEWYKDRNNFVDIEIPYDDVVQEYE